MAELSPEEFDERFAAWLLDGGGEYWSVFGAIMSELHNTITRYIESKSERPLPKKLYRSSRSYIPKTYRHPKPKRPVDAENGDRLARRLGI